MDPPNLVIIMMPVFFNRSVLSSETQEQSHLLSFSCYRKTASRRHYKRLKQVLFVSAIILSQNVNVFYSNHSVLHLSALNKYSTE